MAVLTSSQVNDLLSRNGTLNTDVQEFNLLGLFGTYSQEAPPTDFLSWLGDGSFIGSPIPEYGLIINDATYGYVVIFPDANGNLNYNSVNSNSPALNSAQSIAAGGGSPLPSNPLGSLWTMAIVFGVAFIFFNSKSSPL